MHQYLKAIGFENLHSKKELRVLLNKIENEFTHQIIVSNDDTEDFCVLKKEYGKGIGITVCGELDENKKFNAEYYFPYFEGGGVTTCAEITVEKRIEKEQYVGICEDPRVGISLMFYLKNGLEYMKKCEKAAGVKQSTSITFSGLALAGKILLPIQKSKYQVERERENSKNRIRLLNAARSGDQGAIETLTLEDIDTYSRVSQRLIHEDVFSIVDTYFMPYGIECDMYSVMGEILSISESENSLTKEILYNMKLNINELKFDICVPKSCVFGVPDIGRRFKGTIWLQGAVNF